MGRDCLCRFRWRQADARRMRFRCASARRRCSARSCGAFVSGCLMKGPRRDAGWSRAWADQSSDEGKADAFEDDSARRNGFVLRTANGARRWPPRHGTPLGRQADVERRSCHLPQHHIEWQLCGCQDCERYVGSGSRAGARTREIVALKLPVAADRREAYGRHHGVSVSSCRWSRVPVDSSSRPYCADELKVVNRRWPHGGSEEELSGQHLD